MGISADSAASVVAVGFARGSSVAACDDGLRRQRVCFDSLYDRPLSAERSNSGHGGSDTPA